MRRARENWFDRKWKNRRALRARERRSAKYRARLEQEQGGHAGPGGDDAPLAVSGNASTGVVCEVRSDTCVVIAGERCYESLTRVPVVVGDRVRFAAEGNYAVILEVLPRKSKLVRMRGDATRRSAFSKEEHVLAANVDVAVIVASAAAPPFHPRLIDRYLIMCQYGGIRPIICVNKIDLVTTRPDLSLYTDMDIPVVYVSALTGAGMERLKEHLRGRCSVLTGKSGVGKSSIFNALLRETIQRVGELTRTGRGRHTTTSSLMYRLDHDTFIIDTPGIRSLGLWDIDPDSLRLYFPDFLPFATACRYRDCSHTHEPDCAVKEAVSRGGVAPGRYESYRRLMNELVGK
ncbi:ribosome small subunit-dependent GTPase A [Thermaerobacter marianensis]|uniref:ribosome small subunit-dependent GTPase A n=1 Tax=Thermaerobacter marianensis TaxID=73919 RepID=UPI0011D21065|nr:ribosome small subunit-dependent GTPase A [Thermaerobacter marianensis]